MYIHVHVHVVHACIPDIYVLFQQGESLLHAATSSGQLEVVKFLHDKLADVKAVDKVNISRKATPCYDNFVLVATEGRHGIKI